MADNLSIKDSGGTNRTLATAESGGVHTPKHVIVDGEAFIGAVGGPCDLITITPTVNTGGAHASGDVLFDATAIAGSVRAAGQKAVLQSVTIHDKAANTQEIDLLFFRTTHALGTPNSAPSINDADSLDIIAIVNVPSSAFKNIGPGTLATITDQHPLLKLSSGTTMYVAAITRGTPTFGSTSDLVLDIGFVWN